MAGKFLEYPTSLVNNIDRKSLLTVFSSHIGKLLNQGKKFEPVIQQPMPEQATCN